MSKREAQLQAVIGTQGVGKTYTTNQLIKQYPHVQGRPVLIFDVNGEYSDYPAIEYDIGINSRKKRSFYIEKLGKTRKIARILGLKKNKQPMSLEEKKETLITLGEYFPRGMLVLEDVNKYERNFDSGAVLSTIVNLRHKGGGAGVDAIAHFQTVQVLRGILMGNAKFLRLHYTQDDPVKFKNRLNNYMNIQLGYITVKRKYYESLEYLSSKGMSFDDYKTRGMKMKSINHNIANQAFYCCLIGLDAPTFYNISDEDMKLSLIEYYTNYEKVLHKIKDKEGFINNELKRYKYFLK